MQPSIVVRGINRVAIGRPRVVKAVGMRGQRSQTSVRSSTVKFEAELFPHHASCPPCRQQQDLPVIDVGRPFGIGLSLRSKRPAQKPFQKLTSRSSATLRPRHPALSRNLTTRRGCAAMSTMGGSLRRSPVVSESPTLRQISTAVHCVCAGRILEGKGILRRG